MKKTGILFALLAILSYGTAQKLDKKNKRYENFIFQQKQNPNLKLMELTIKSSDKLTSERFNELRIYFFEKEGIIDFQTGKESGTYILYYSSFVDEQSIMDLLNASGLNYEKLNLSKL